MTTHEKALALAGDTVWNCHFYDIDAFCYGQKFITPDEKTAGVIAQTAITAYLSALLPADVAGLVERLTNERPTNMMAVLALHLEAVSLIQSQAARIAELEADSLYVVWSHEHSCWWRANSQGYARRVEDAGLYSREGAIRISHRGRDGWHPDEMPDELPIRVRDLPKFAQDALLNKDASHD